MPSKITILMFIGHRWRCRDWYLLWCVAKLRLTPGGLFQDLDVFFAKRLSHCYFLWREQKDVLLLSGVFRVWKQNNEEFQNLYLFFLLDFFFFLISFFSQWACMCFRRWVKNSFPSALSTVNIKGRDLITFFYFLPVIRSASSELQMGKISITSFFLGISNPKSGIL